MLNSIIIIVTFILFIQYVFLIIAINDDCLRYIGIKTKTDFLLYVNDGEKTYLDWFPKKMMIDKNIDKSGLKSYIRIDEWILKQKVHREGNLMVNNIC